MEPTEHDPITRRLHSLGDQPVDPEVASRHRSLIAAVPVAASRSRLRPLMVGSLLAGSLLGGMGLAAAAPGVPDSASDAAKTVLATVTLGAVEHPNREAKEAEREAEKAEHDAKKAEHDAKKAEHDADDDRGVTRARVPCGGFTGNHGQYVSSVEDNPDTDVNERQVAAQSDCGKPVHPPKPQHEDNANKPANPGQSNGDHDPKNPDDDDAPGRSGGDHPDDEAGSGISNRPATAGKSSGHGPGGAED